MPMPEFVVQEGIRKAWELVKRSGRKIDVALRYLKPDRQQRYRDLIEREDPVIHFQNPDAKPRVPSFVIALASESESPQGQFLGDDGLDYREGPYPAVAPEDFYPQEDFLGLVYSEEDCPTPVTVDGPSVAGVSLKRIRLEPEKNLHLQRASLDDSEQREQMGVVPRLYDKDKQRLSLKSYGDEVTVTVTITTANFETTFVFYRLLRWGLRRLRGWFHANGLLNLTFSGSDVALDESLQPTTGGPAGPFRRVLTMQFYHEDYDIFEEAIVRQFLLEMDMATPRQDGSLEYTRIAEVSFGETEET